MAITINGSSGLTLPNLTVVGASTLSGNLAVTGAVTTSNTLTTTAVTTSTIGPLSGNTITVVDPGVSGASLGVKVVLAPVTVSGTSTFTIASNIPSWVRRVTILSNNTNTSAGWGSIQFGTAAGWITSGYVGGSQYGSSATYVAWSSGAFFGAGYGSLTFNLGDTTNHIWAGGGYSSGSGGTGYNSGGIVTLSAPLTQIRFTSSGGSATLSGSLGVMYE